MLDMHRVGNETISMLKLKPCLESQRRGRGEGEEEEEERWRRRRGEEKRREEEEIK